MSTGRISHRDPNATSRGHHEGRRLKGEPLDHTYYIQADGDTRVWYDPKVTANPDARYRATCDVCPWLGDWHDGRDGPELADFDGHVHRTDSLGTPGWDHCETCGMRVAPGKQCAGTYHQKEER